MSRRLSRAALALVITPTLAMPGFAVPASAAEADQTTINILGITDFHGHISQTKGRDGSVAEIGANALSCYIDNERVANPNTSFVSAGDNIGGSAFESSILQDKPTIEVLNAMGLDASAVGNHELDKGWNDLNGRVGVHGDKLAKFPYLSANMQGADIAPTTIVERDGVRIAYVGAITDTTNTLVSPAGIPGITFSEPIAAVNAQAAALKNDGKADVVIGLVHEGVEPTGFTKDVDAVIAGHTHKQRNEPGQPPVVQPGNYGNALADIDVVYDKADKKVVSVTTANHTAAEMAAACGDKANPEVARIVSAAKQAAEAEGQKVVATLSNDFYRGSNVTGGSGSNRGTESTLNSLLADATLESVNAGTDLNAEIGVMNAGGVRADLEKGDVTFSEAYAVQPFNNTLATVDITGAEFTKVLEQQWRESNGGRPTLILGLSKNVQYSYDPTAPIGSKVTAVYVNGQPIDPAKTYRVAGSTFLLNEGDGYTGFNTASGANTIRDTGIVDVDAFNQYLAANGDVQPRTDQTSVGVTFRQGDATVAATELPGGQKVTVDLSSLSYTTPGEPQAKTATVEFGTPQAGAGNAGDAVTWTEPVSAPVDNTITDNNNETGQAHLEATVPAGASLIRVRTDSGTDFTMPIKVTGGTGEGNGNGDNNPGGGTGSTGSTGSINWDVIGSSQSPDQARQTVWNLLFGGALSAIAALGLFTWARDHGFLPAWLQRMIQR